MAKNPFDELDPPANPFDEPPKPPRVTVKSGAKAIGSGAASTALAFSGGSVGDLRQAGKAGVDNVLGLLIHSGIINPAQAQQVHGFIGSVYRGLNPIEGGMSASGRIAGLMDAATGGNSGPVPTQAPTTADLQAATHTNYAPQNRTERYLKVGGSMAAGALVPGGFIRRAAAVVVPTVASEGGREAVQAAGGSEQAQNAAALAGGLLGGTVATGIRTPRGLIPSTSEAGFLEREGVSLTPGERVGGMAKAFEDKAVSLPILGDAIIGARVQGRRTFNRAAANRALAPIDETVPNDVQPGHETVAHVESRLDAAYDRANGMIEAVAPDETFSANMAGIRAGLKGQPPSVQRAFDRLVKDRVTARLEAGPLDGAALQDVRSQLRELAADNLAGGGADRTLGRHLTMVDAELGALAERQSPGYRAAKGAADQGWAHFVRLRRAASSVGAEGGVFTPAHLKSAVRAEDASVGKGAMAKGTALMGDLADAGAGVMGSKIPDSGTAGRIFAGGFITGNPLTFPAAAALYVAGHPYRMIARRVVKALGDSPTHADLLDAEAKLAAMAAKDPRVAPLHDRVLKALQEGMPMALSSVVAASGRDQQ